MEKENNQNKKRKIKVKANTSKNKTLLLKKEFLYRDTSTLILKNLVKRKGFKKGLFKNSEAYFEKCLSSTAFANDNEWCPVCWMSILGLIRIIHQGNHRPAECLGFANAIIVGNILKHTSYELHSSL